MNKKEREIKTEINGIPDLKAVPEGLMDAFIDGLIESLEECRKKSSAPAEDAKPSVSK